ncbi:MAG: TonB family protein [Proteobacteria bacterium]|nr:TonB family protein [Pseudomonadota bacterium]MBU1964456.1 TonB family protein [Pseudomonadota bacterium]
MISERAGRESSGRGRLNGMIFISLLFHAAVLSLLFFSPSFPSPKLTFGPVYTVALVNFSGKTLEQKGVAAGAKELMEAGRSETVLRKRLKAEPVIPIRSLESRKKQDRTLEKAMEEIRKRAAAAEPTPKPQTKAGSDAKAMPEAKAGPASPLPAGDVDMNAKINAYYATIWFRIKRGWALPQGILPGDVLETVIDVTILRSGAVTDVNFEKRSGNRFFDESALKAIRKASPFPPLPAWVGEASLDVGIRFHSSELRP